MHIAGVKYPGKLIAAIRQKRDSVLQVKKSQANVQVKWGNVPRLGLITSGQLDECYCAEGRGGPVICLPAIAESAG